MDALNLLLEHGADLQVENENSFNSFEQMIRNDNADLLGCVFDRAAKH